MEEKVEVEKECFERSAKKRLFWAFFVLNFDFFSETCGFFAENFDFEVPLRPLLGFDWVELVCDLNIIMNYHVSVSYEG